ncbi:hypothetical protein PDESU_00058 [Pontiella desulfatans]|uniref:3-keto-alpha-glucoside-1,2-lyase/3-keto-2-hydroxy-glucal hydratase domain-containing protein n=1 Tax=Pontiella desulfatans TaxID=2750659 RepID=A0A6C2TVK0_PONDE|nr:DUF1080 domain-containing protein [Pontiella desulfatans]VGO11514.1 hypothetical protein PDESU_00058 [Pontiella desulfatans]
MKTTSIKRTLPCIIGLASLTQFALGNQVSESQVQYIKKYEKQANVPVPAEMLLNTDPEPQLESGFTALYNGKDLAGWTPLGGTCTFEAKGDTILGTCVKGSPSTYLSTVKADYADFIFTAEMKWEVDGNSGVMFRGLQKPGKNDAVIVYGPQAEMEGFATGRGWSGGIYGQSAGGWFYPLWLESHAEARNALKEGDWNRITIKAQGDTFKTWINGVPAGHLKNDEYKQGFFSLQVHSGKQGCIHFRNLKVKEL